jgi:uncharacterized protein YqhQ
MDVGGQAVIEGVMMRNKDNFAIAVRDKKGKIRVKKEKSTKLSKVLNLFLIRGVIVLFLTMYDGIRALVWSGNQQEEEQEQLTNKEIIGTISFALFFSIIFFVVVPFFVAHWISSNNNFLFNVLDGLFRIILFLGYLIIISTMDDVKILFSYHGAEHKSIACYENGEKLTVANAKKFSRFHPRCGTSFLFIVLLISIFIFSLIQGHWWIKLLGRILALPIIASISYELIKLSGKYQHNFVVKILILPGLWLQRLTTREPSDKQLEVGLRSLKEVL